MFRLSVIHSVFSEANTHIEFRMEKQSPIQDFFTMGADDRNPDV